MRLTIADMNVFFTHFFFFCAVNSLHKRPCTAFEFCMYVPFTIQRFGISFAEQTRTAMSMAIKSSKKKAGDGRGLQ